MYLSCDFEEDVGSVPWDDDSNCWDYYYGGYGYGYGYGSYSYYYGSYGSYGSYGYGDYGEDPCACDLHVDWSTSTGALTNGHWTTSVSYVDDGDDDCVDLTGYTIELYQNLEEDDDWSDDLKYTLSLIHI